MIRSRFLWNHTSFYFGNKHPMHLVRVRQRGTCARICPPNTRLLCNISFHQQVWLMLSQSHRYIRFQRGVRGQIAATMSDAEEDEGSKIKVWWLSDPSFNTRNCVSQLLLPNIPGFKRSDWGRASSWPLVLHPHLPDLLPRASQTSLHTLWAQLLLSLHQVPFVLELFWMFIISIQGNLSNSNNAARPAFPILGNLSWDQTGMYHTQNLTQILRLLPIMKYSDTFSTKHFMHFLVFSIRLWLGQQSFCLESGKAW